jgi:BolA protein
VKIENGIRAKIEEQFKPSFLQIINESHLHGRKPGAESHFNIVVVSDQFESLSRVDRTRKIQGLLEAERKMGLHALSLRTFTPAEWPKAQEELDLSSPKCMHKDKTAKTE